MQDRNHFLHLHQLEQVGTAFALLNPVPVGAEGAAEGVRRTTEDEAVKKNVGEFFRINEALRVINDKRASVLALQRESARQVLQVGSLPRGLVETWCLVEVGLLLSQVTKDLKSAMFGYKRAGYRITSESRVGDPNRGTFHMACDLGHSCFSRLECTTITEIRQDMRTTTVPSLQPDKPQFPTNQSTLIFRKMRAQLQKP